MKNRVGLIFSYNERWIGGTYYIINLVDALNRLDANTKPELIIFSNTKDFQLLKNETNYPYLLFERMDENPSSKILRLLNRISGKLIRRKLIKRRFQGNIDAIFPYQRNNFLNYIPEEKRIYWIPDLQEKHYPENYSSEHLKRELEVNSSIVMNSKKLLLSSMDVLNDLKEFYPSYRTKPYVVHFAVQHPDISRLNESELQLKYSLPENYFFAPNQFWKHKNQMLVIKAVERLKSAGVEVCVAFSGKEFDGRSPGYTEGLKDYVLTHGLSENIRFLGFIDRREQLKIMEMSLAVIQPSLFEGWSTVIEDAMAQNKVVLASDLDVNKEQLKDQGYYFDRHNPEDLARVLELILEVKPVVYYDYKKKQLDFAHDFMNCLID
jgi:glycosyltransferase involved in cell wall biosynthesis